MSRTDIFHCRTQKLRICLLIAFVFLSGCSHMGAGRQTQTNFAEATDLFHQGDYASSMNKYSEIIEKQPRASDRALFEMGIVLSHPKNEQKDYQKSLEYFQRLVRDYPDSEYRQNSELMIFNIRNSILKDQTISAQTTQLETTRLEMQNKDIEIATLKKQLETLKQAVVASEQEIKAAKQELAAYVQQQKTVDKVLVEKSLRRLTLLSSGEAVKSYKIALGGNPIGHKERQGDKKTPEGTYYIEGRNKNSKYYLSLRISYPNDQDRRRAIELGVNPGGDIMIHGLKNDFSMAGESHAEVDWTEGCIAVTNEEILEIEKLVKDGTVVEIRP